ncbi:MAG: sugar phosphate isomerase/epimerase family protein [Candidatus Brocadiia bacterium]
MIIGCFALVEPFAPMERQLALIRQMGIEYVDLTDNHNGGMLGVEYGFTASVSLDVHPARVRAMVEEACLTLTSVCAHANLLDPTSPDTYSTHEIIKAIRLAHLLGVDQVITTEGEPRTAFGQGLSPEQRLFTICEKLQAPIAWAEELGVQLLLEPHGEVTDRVDGMEAILDRLGHDETVGVCLDTGNSWLGGSEPLEFVEAFGTRIRHVHWKDLGEQWEAKRGSVFGTGMATIPLGDGVVGIRQVVEALEDAGFRGPTTLEVAGAENVKLSAQRLREWASA